MNNINSSNEVSINKEQAIQYVLSAIEHDMLVSLIEENDMSDEHLCHQLGCA